MWVISFDLQHDFHLDLELLHVLGSRDRIRGVLVRGALIQGNLVHGDLIHEALVRVTRIRLAPIRVALVLWQLSM